MVDSRPPRVIVVRAPLWAAILAHLHASLPNEGVGLVSATGARDVVQPVRFYPGRNLNESPSRFTMDPLDVLRALEDMDREGTRLGAIVHSHPRTDPVPSQTDLRELALPGVVNLIVQLSPHTCARAWDISSDGAAEVTVHIEANVPGEERQR